MRKPFRRPRFGAANCITCLRAVLSLALLPLQAFSRSFLTVYLLAGATDMLDGFWARRTGTVSERGAKLDTAADLCFFAAAAYKLCPVLPFSKPVLACIAGIAAVKAFTIAVSLRRNKRFPAVHSLLNRLTGLLLFAYPFFARSARACIVTVLLCALAAAAALQESRYIIKAGKEQKEKAC